MTDPTNPHPENRPRGDAAGAPDGAGPPPRDELDALLRRWHDVNAGQAAAGRDRLLARLRAERQRQTQRTGARAATSAPGALTAAADFLRRMLMNRYSPAVASLTFIVVLIALLVPGPRSEAWARQVMVPEGGRLDAVDDEGNVMGPCPLRHTDVDVSVSGFFSRVNVTQTYENLYEKKIEAVYTFPLSHRAAVDRMTMTVGDRVVVGEVKEREAARRIYEAAREQGYVASLLEQERPNIFTQSVANIEPGAEVVVEISYVETLVHENGTYRFDFPMVVGPRYIPGAPTVSPGATPAELKPRHGVVLLGPAKLALGAAGDVSEHGTLQTGKLNALLTAATPIQHPGDDWWGRGDATGGAGQPQLWYRFEAEYTDGSKELGELYTDGTGRINGRWFYADPKTIEGMGTGYGQDTDEVPDGSRITPEPVKPGRRAGHDISVAVTIDTGGPGIENVESELHEIVRTEEAVREDGLPGKVTVALADAETIPNRDFVLSWSQTADTIQEATFTHTADDLGAYSGGFFTVIVQPPARVQTAEVPPRELVFVMDTSGSMRGFPLDKSKAVMTRAIDAMRPADTFNVITFAGRTAILWQKPRPASAENRAEAKAFVESRRGGGGTEMMKAINAALVQTAGDGPVPLSPRQLADLPADGRAVEVHVAYTALQSGGAPGTYSISAGPELTVPLRLETDLPPVLQPEGVVLRLDGRWATESGRRVFIVTRAGAGGEEAGRPMRIVLFLTDGYVGNDMAIMQAVRDNARTTRVFSFGIGNSVNRYLLEGMARAGRGEAEFVLLESDADEAVARLTRRIETPVLTDIELAFSESLDVFDLLPPPDAVPDLFDVEPLVIHGRYRGRAAGTLTIRGRTGAGPYERSVELELPESQPAHDVIATLWAREKVEAEMAPHLQAVQRGNPPQDLRQEVVALGEQFQIMTQYTSFVAVEKSRMTIGGDPVLVAVPIEMPEGVSYEGVFGETKAGERPVALQSGAVRTSLAKTPPPASAAVSGVPQAPAAMPGRRPAGPKRQARGDATMGRRTSGPAAGRNMAGGMAGGAVLADVAEEAESAPVDGDAARRRVVTAGLEQAQEQLRRGNEQAAREMLDHLESFRVDDAPVTLYRKLLDLRMELDADEQRRIEDLVQPAQTPPSLLPQRLAVAAGTLYAEGDVETAATIARQLAASHPAYAPGVELSEAIEARAGERVVELAATAGAELEAELRTLRLKRVLHPALRPLLEDADARPADVEFRDGRALVTVLAETLDAGVRSALAEAGLAVEATSDSVPMAVGTVAPDDLEALALVSAVRRIEPTRYERR